LPAGPYGKLAFTRRQNNYVSALGGREVYTPQVFINGKTSFVGSDEKRMRAEVDKALSAPAPATLSLTVDSLVRDTLFLQYAASRSGPNLSLALALVRRRAETAVTRGENEGKKLSHANVVRVFDLFPLATRTGQAALPLNGLKPGNDFALIGYVQQKHILAATALHF
jgi:hypothetical protein